MNLNLPHKLRAMLYVITAVGSPVFTYLLAKGVISELEVTLWSAEVTVVSILAALNIAKPGQPPQDEQ